MFSCGRPMWIFGKFSGSSSPSAQAAQPRRSRTMRRWRVCGWHSAMRIGVISDTHGLLRPEVLTALAGVEHILHAGDIGDIAILDALRSIAPVTAIRGNIDTSGA